ncbi:MAG: CapA family protein [Bacillota bacterium]
MKKWIILIIFLFLMAVCPAVYPSSDEVQITSPVAGMPQGTLMAVGDLSFAGIGPLITKDPGYPWVNVKPILQSATILVGNQEVPFSTRGAAYTQKKWLLRAEPQTVQALVNAGFTVVTLANNHIMDYGPPALEDTLKTLDEAKILHTGAGMNLQAAREPVIFTAPGGVKFAFLAYSLVFPELYWANSSRPGTPYGDPGFFIQDIKKAKALADFVVVSFHWSDELHYFPSDYQKNYARKCIEAGASIVLGHHPHVLQGLEVYRGGLIAYSLGNFAFCTYSKNVKDSIILGVDYDQKGLIQARIYPVNINNYEVNFQTRPRHGADAERVLQDLRTYSSEFKTVIQSAGDTGIIQIRD